MYTLVEVLNFSKLKGKFYVSYFERGGGGWRDIAPITTLEETS
jgi:hypothetical protein